MNKNFIGCELDKEYYNAAVNRIYKECLPKLFRYGKRYYICKKIKWIKKNSIKN